MDYRAYFFGNMYLSSIQQGIQAGHVIADMFVKYYRPVADDTFLSLFEWARDDKVMVLLNAGYGEEIHDLSHFFHNKQNPYPFASFQESEEALDGASTSIGIILPATIYNASKLIRESILDPEKIRETGTIKYFNGSEHVEYDISKWEFDMILRLNNYGLAR